MIILGIFGIGELLIYGVMLLWVKFFVIVCIGGVVGGFFIGFIFYLGLLVGFNMVFGLFGVVVIFLMILVDGIFVGMVVFVGGLFIFYIVGFVVIYFFGCKDVDLS